MFLPNDVKRMPDGVDGSSTSTSADVAELNDENGVEVEEPPDTELEESEEELEEDSEEEPEGGSEGAEESDGEAPTDIHPFDRPSVKSIQEAYPDFFKKFPAMRDMYFREAEYSKLFPTVDEAKEAQNNNSAFLAVRDDVFNGSGEKFLNAVKTDNPAALQKFASTFLGTLVKVDTEAFWRAANPLVEDVARNMFKKGTAEGNESLANAGKYLAYYFFGDADIAEGKKTSLPSQPATSDVSKEREEWENSKQLEFRGGVEKDLRGQLVELITGTDLKTGRNKLDPDDVLSPFIRNTIIDRVIQDIGNTLATDKQHLSYMDSLWARSKQNGRTDSDKSRIIAAYLARARSLAPSLRSKYVSEAMGKKVRDVNQKRVKLASVEGRTPQNGRVASGGSKGYSPKSIDYRKTSDYDILNDDITYKN